MGGELHPVMQEIRDYVTCRDETRYDNVPSGYYRMNVTHSNLDQKWHDLCFAGNMTISQVKDKLHKHGGSRQDYMELYLRRGEHGGTVLMANENFTLNDYNASHGMEIHIKDTDPHSLSRAGGLENVDLVEKYVMTEEEYDKRANTLRAYKKKMQATDPNFKFMPMGAKGQPKGESEPKPERAPTPPRVREEYIDGARCEVNPGGRRGTVRFCGPVKGPQGTFIGVQLDGPLGSNDGSKADQRYFQCDDGYGVFARPENVDLGDFPEFDPLASDDEV